MIALLLAMMVGAPPGESFDTAVVCPVELQPALLPWLQHRQSQGRRIAMIPGGQSAQQIRDEIRRLARGGDLQWVVLVGDAVANSRGSALSQSLLVPTHRADAKINIRWGSEPDIATDNWYADLDDDQVPDLAIGRITADSPAELALIVRKIVRYETSAAGGAWRRRINFVAGVGGFGPVVDSLLEMATKRFLTEGIPASYETTMTYASWRSPFCPDPRRFQQTAIERHNEGCLFWVYIGHGQRTYLDQVRTPAGRFPILDTDNMAELRAAEGAPIAVFLACYTGAFDQPRDCLAEEMLRTEGGPVAILCGSRVTMPYAMAVMADGLLHECFRNQPETIGEVFLKAKQSLARAPESEGAQASDNRKLLNVLGAAFSPNADELQAERREHLLLFNLLGDPLLRVRQPRPIEVRFASAIEAGQRLRIEGACDLAGPCQIELVCRRDRTRSTPPARSSFATASDALENYNEIYRQANDRRWAAFRTMLTGGDFQLELPIPLEARGPCYVRLHAHNEDDFAVGAGDVFIRRPLEPDTPSAP